MFDLARDILKIAGSQPRTRSEHIRDAIETLCAVLFGLLVLAATIGVWALGASVLFKAVFGS